ncbi:MAG: PorV/PorQ family protein [Candidatus Cloacimonetes bacterium]|nr:PorV/PorQ family protein [Candidatus Cloacimonadota bacterium]
MLYRKILSYSILILCITSLIAVNENAGTTGFNNLQVIYSARAMGMAKAMTGVYNSLEGLQFNPAAILGVEDKIISSTYNSYFVDTNGGGAHFLYSKSEEVSYGLILHYLNFGEIERTFIDDNYNYQDTDETFTANNIIFGASAARNINVALDLGVSIKYIMDKIDTYSASAVVADLGLIHHPVLDKIKVGVALRNVGTQLTYYTEKKYKEKLPFTIAAGLSYQMNPKLIGCIDVSKASSSDLTMKFSTEYKLHQMLSLRAGFNSNNTDWKTGGTWDWASGLTFGTGFNWKNYVIDYGIASYGDLGFVNQVSLQYRF